MNARLLTVRDSILSWYEGTNLWDRCLYGSILVHFLCFGTYYVVTHLKPGEIDSDRLEFQDIEVDIQEIPPELIGGENSPAPVEKEEWVEGSDKDGKDPEDNDIDPNKLSGDGTDKDGFLYAYMGDKPPTPIIDFDLRDYFPEKAKLQGISYADTILEVRVDEHGNLIDAKVLKAGIKGYGFEDAAIRVVRAARWSPGYVKGRPIKMNHRIPVNFKLDD
ncbi:TonB protein, C-terminal domain protein [Leptospira inadai serovar Lyme str. 10]|uniref:TonB protein, C-terminal domain protein n=2 Tax=Leptospira inadai serovar Lyme TaxID=293084 RepID=V6HBA2_9LEPT|nr:energy transducer TonB [Leptospira inadai]EQA35838.1 TonB protein, C-terminal domain protein [Leptospira inadai serovar Lyme str. 10]PNV76920.1 energy transducer TonB [Leptospira inadai serovar Lyme]